MKEITKSPYFSSRENIQRPLPETAGHDAPDLGLALLHSHVIGQLPLDILLPLLLLLQLPPLVLLTLPIGSLILGVRLKN